MWKIPRWWFLPLDKRWFLCGSKETESKLSIETIISYDQLLTSWQALGKSIAVVLCNTDEDNKGSSMVGISVLLNKKFISYCLFAWLLNHFSRTSKHGRSNAAHDSTQRHGTTGTTGNSACIYICVCIYTFFQPKSLKLLLFFHGFESVFRAMEVEWDHH